jgi:dihydropyrimidine dehydrogenase (NAD+) subunit PreA
MQNYLSSNRYQSVSEIVGKGISQVIAADDLDRTTICFPRFNRSKCVGCGRCVLSCRDGGHQALRQDESSSAPLLDAKKCVGCHLCVVVCPANAVAPGVRIPKNYEQIKRKKEIV